MHAVMESLAGSHKKASEDWVAALSGAAVVLDGGTARTETGCVHGVQWYAHQLGAAIVARVAGAATLSECLAQAIDHVAASHPGCDLTHPGTPSAAVGIVRVHERTLEFLVLGDITIVILNAGSIRIVADHRVSDTAQPARRAAELLPIGSAEKAAALLEMKAGELAARNRPGGYWVAATEPAAVAEAKTGSVPLEEIQSVALLSDGAARLVDFGILDWTGALDLLVKEGPEGLIDRVRIAEASDPQGIRWPRNKTCDDATAVYLDALSPPSPESIEE